MSGMKFCKECNNLMNPSEDKNDRTLIYRCHRCSHNEVADSNCVHKNQILKNLKHELPASFQLEYMSADPTLPKAQYHCNQCNGEEARVFHQTKGEDSGLEQYFICCKCYTLTNPNFLS